VTARLRLDEGSPRKGDVDGAWWPRSRALAIELPNLLETLAPRLGRIALVAYHPDDWDTEPAAIAVDGHTVRLESLSATSDGSDAVAVMAADGQCITLALVAPDSGDAHAHAMLTAAARPHPKDDPKDPHSENTGAAASTTTRALGDVVDRLNRHSGSPTEQQHTDIARRVHDTAAQFTHSPIQAYVPILVENLVRNQLAAAAAQHPPSGSADH
jgi:hypothetical protein